MRTEQLGVAYSGKPAVNGVDLQMSEGEVLALIGPSGCGKTTLLRSLNRLVDQTPTAVRTGAILLDDEDVDLLDVTELRRKVGMVFQQPNPFPMSVFDNVAYGLRERGSRRPGRRALKPAVEEALERAGLLEEVKDNLGHPALRLSGGQQQRLCIARSLAINPEVLLLDEPCSALDPRSTAIIEELIMKLRSEIAIVIVTHNLQQAYRVADRVGFMYLGDLVEYGEADKVFSEPKAKPHARVRKRRLRLSRWRALSTLLVLLSTAVLAACQSTQDKARELQEQGLADVAAQEGITIAQRNKEIKVVGTTLLHDQYGDAVVVELQNTSKQAQVNVPILIDLRDAKGKSVYRNDVPGLEPSLTYVPLSATGRDRRLGERPAAAQR